MIEIGRTSNWEASLSLEGEVPVIRELPVGGETPTVRKCCCWKRRLLLGSCVVGKTRDLCWGAVLSIEVETLIVERSCQ